MRVTATVNGVEHSADVDPRTLLVDFLRDDLALTGTHIGCEDGKCGACTIRLDGRVVKSCMLLAVQADGAEVGTVEGLADGEELSPLQAAFHEQHGLQCGYCTPGFLMASQALLEQNSEPTEAEVRAHLVGNICRCTGYNNIVAAVVAAASARTAAATAAPDGGTEPVAAPRAADDAISAPGAGPDGLATAAERSGA
jgi:carbon-monoxide dehydrogenase small subunit